MSSAKHLAFAFTLITAAAACAPPAYAVTCSPFIQYERIVGDTASDKNCTDNDIQTAINNVVCPNTTIYVTGEHTYTAQHLNIQNLSVTIAGTSAPTCNLGGTGGGGATAQPASVPTAPVITISGAGHSGDSVISVRGNSNVTLQYLDITSGAEDANQGGGGGISFVGQGSLTLDTDTVEKNFAAYGGGIYSAAAGGDITLTLKHNTSILNNTAQYEGGGIRIDGYTHLYMLEAASTIAFNKTLGVDPGTNNPSDGYGGGIAVFGGAIADIASPGAFFVGAVSNNSAPYGGGIALIASSSGQATARLFSVNPNAPVVFSENSASIEGGAVYSKPYISDTGGNTANAALCAQDFRIDANTAPQGAAIYTDQASNGLGGSADLATVNFNSGGNCTVTPSLASLGAVACTAGIPCNEVSDNNAVDAQNNPSGGSILYFNQAEEVSLDRFAMRGNAGGQLVSAFALVSGNYLSNCLIVDNHTQHELVHAFDASLSLDNCTFANNAIDSGYVLYAAKVFALKDSIVYEPGESTLDYVADGCPGCASIANVVATETATLSDQEGATNVVQNGAPYPLFVDATNSNVAARNYHLPAYVQNGNVIASPAIDFAPPVAGDDRDLDDNPHDQDVPLVPNFLGDRDLGAYEAQPIADRIFADGFGDAISLVY